ncbi:hypothetical protein BV22DRAFT_1077497 [Leucogyrophana mollusca]|uniref:Uncharacterized protein n=1 Tax=Leucogyrophana mollusca TaxID=85980 RepID=A0ACB8BZ32_9AGAM|nr:hypothetical protein BV22DRAFT_1077497 [Leucogyrophana mollusca]
MPRSASLSPARKRMRLSSPTYDDQIGDLSQDDINALDEIEARLSQGPQTQAMDSGNAKLPSSLDFRAPVAGRSSPPSNREAFSSQEVIPMDDDDNPFTSDELLSSTSTAAPLLADPSLESGARIYAPFMKASAVLPAIGFQSASFIPRDSLHDTSRSPSPEASQEPDYSTWFQSDVPGDFVGFKPATSALGSFQTASSMTAAIAGPSVAGEGSRLTGSGGFITPSLTALRRAEEKIKLWQEDTHSPSLSQSPPKLIPHVRTSQPISPRRTVLGAVHNSFPPTRIPETPTPATNLGKSAILGGLPGFRTPTLGTTDNKSRNKVKPFKSPLMSTATPKPLPNPTSASVGYTSSPLNPTRQTAQMGSQHHPTSSLAPATPLRLTFAIANNPPYGATQPSTKSTPARPRFVTPFKIGMKPGDPGRAALTLEHAVPSDSGSRSVRSYPPSISQPKTASKDKGKNSWTVFNLTPPANRISLGCSGLCPQSYTDDELGSMGLNLSELHQISLNTALFYSFHAPSSLPPEGSQPASPPKLLGHATALEELHARGCSLATEAWVKNHWPLILWKLAGMAALEPQREADLHKKRWCWPEVIRQLLYRYERDLNGSSRPPLRLISTRDAPAASPMVLCISNITWSEAGVDDDGFPTVPFPELEVTDGWYRLRAKIDAPLARAVRNGTIRVGRKIGVAGSKLESQRKDPSEILEAYDSNVLSISGNSSHLAPWHAKLGFQSGPFISTLNSLTADGGTVAVMALEIIKVFPVAYIEFVEGENGRKRREGPRSAKDEAAVSARWRLKRETEASKLWSEFEKRMNLLAGYAERLEQRAGAQFCPKDEDSPPDNIDSLCDDILDDPVRAKAVLATVSSTSAGWLARQVREQGKKEQEAARDDIERELQATCPPRDIRDFRVIIVRDAYTRRHPPNRKAQLTVWDVLGLSSTEGGEAGIFEPGQKFLISNLMPTQQSAWMGRDVDSEVYLSTRKNSRWKKII